MRTAFRTGGPCFSIFSPAKQRGFCRRCLVEGAANLSHVRVGGFSRAYPVEDEFPNGNQGFWPRGGCFKHGLISYLCSLCMYIQTIWRMPLSLFWGGHLVDMLLCSTITKRPAKGFWVAYPQSKHGNGNGRSSIAMCDMCDFPRVWFVCETANCQRNDRHWCQTGVYKFCGEEGPQSCSFVWNSISLYMHPPSHLA